MKRKTTHFFLAFLTLLMFSYCSNAAVETWTLEPHHTSILWKVDHLGFSIQSGKFYATGTIRLDDKNPKNSRVNATIKMADIVTGQPELDKHLLGQQFFDNAHYPTATFTSDRVELISKNSGKIYGTLNLHGVSKHVTLDVSLNKKGLNPINNKMTMGFTAKTMIKRSDFGMTTLIPAVGDEIDLEISAEAFKDN